MPSATVATIGFTKTTAEGFFERLLRAGVTKVVDVRLHNTSQLAGFAKAEDLGYFLKKLGDIQYMHEPLLAPTDPMLKAYKKEKAPGRLMKSASSGSWPNAKSRSASSRRCSTGLAFSAPKPPRITATGGSCANTSTTNGTTHWMCVICETHLRD